MVKEFKVVWTETAYNQLRFIHSYIKLKSPQGADKVLKEIVDTSTSLKYNPEIFSLDPFIKDKTKKIRSYTKHAYKVLYRILKKEIHILRIRHTSRSPLKEI